MVISGLGGFDRTLVENLNLSPPSDGQTLSTASTVKHPLAVLKVETYTLPGSNSQIFDITVCPMTSVKDDRVPDEKFVIKASNYFNPREPSWILPRKFATMKVSMVSDVVQFAF